MKRITILLLLILLSSCITQEDTLEEILSEYSAEPYVLKLSDTINNQWYMGTQSGVDSDLVFMDRNNLKVEEGGCFSIGPIYKSKFTITEKGILINNDKLQDQLGSILYTVKINGHIVFLPEKRLNAIKNYGPQLPISYWPVYEESGIPQEGLPKN